MFKIVGLTSNTRYFYKSYILSSETIVLESYNIITSKELCRRMFNTSVT